MNSKAPLKEIIGWAAYDVANSTYGTVVATAIYNAYFVGVVAGQSTNIPAGQGTLLLTISICVSSLAVVLTAPIFGTISDALAAKKKMLLLSTFVCVLATACLSLFGPGHALGALVVLTLANFAFGTGEDLIAAFLPEISEAKDMGRISAFGWAAGYVGGLVSLGLCLAYVSWAQAQGQQSTQYIPITLVICALFFALVSLPTFILLKERAQPDPEAAKANYVAIGFERLKQTIGRASHYRDLFMFLVTLFVYSCGTATAIHLASVYAQQALKFTASDSITMILVVNVTAAVGAFIFGYVQDKFGSVRTLSVSLLFWTVAIFGAYLAQTKSQLWMAANLVGISMGASGSVGRALVAQFSPSGRSGEFLGLWGLAVKLATACGVLSFGLVAYFTGNNYRAAILFTSIFFIVGLILLSRVDEKRGREAAQSALQQ